MKKQEIISQLEALSNHCEFMANKNEKYGVFDSEWRKGVHALTGAINIINESIYESYKHTEIKEDE